MLFTSRAEELLTVRKSGPEATAPAFLFTLVGRTYSRVSTTLLFTTSSFPPLAVASDDLLSKLFERRCKSWETPVPALFIVFG